MLELYLLDFWLMWFLTGSFFSFLFHCFWDLVFAYFFLCEELSVKSLDKEDIHESYLGQAVARRMRSSWGTTRGERKWMSFQSEWYSTRYPQPVCIWFHQQVYSSADVGTESGALMGVPKMWIKMWRTGLAESQIFSFPFRWRCGIPLWLFKSMHNFALFVNIWHLSLVWCAWFLKIEQCQHMNIQSVY